VADCFRYRSKVSLDVAVEALREFLRRRGRSVDALMKAAEQTRMARVIRPYLGFLATCAWVNVACHRAGTRSCSGSRGC
jgi:hypothetical protein